MNITELKAPQSDCPYCNGTGEADSGGVHLSGAPATIPCRCLYEDPFYVHVSAYNNVAAQLEDAQSENRALLATEQNLREELEVERVRLAACGVVAMSNTRESAAKARKMLPQYESASCMDVARAVDAEMDLRERVKELEEGLRVASQIIGHPDDSFSQHIGALLEQQK